MFENCWYVGEALHSPLNTLKLVFKILSPINWNTGSTKERLTDYCYIHVNTLNTQIHTCIYTRVIYNVHTYMTVYLHFMPVLQLWWTDYSPKDLQLCLNIYIGQYSESGFLLCEVLSLLYLLFCLLWSVFVSFSHSILTSADTNLYFCLISYLTTTNDFNCYAWLTLNSHV